MRLTIFGASGGCGRELVQMALAAGHEVRAVYRSAPDLPAHERLEVMLLADVTDPVGLRAAVAGANAVASALGIRRKNPSNPWSGLVSPADLTARSAAHLVAALQEPGARRRVLAISSGNVGDSRQRTSVGLRLLFDNSQIGLAMADLNRMEAVYASSGLDWMCVRPTTLIDGPEQGYRQVDFYGLGATIRRTDVARFMLDQLAQPGPWTERTPLISAR